MNDNWWIVLLAYIAGKNSPKKEPNESEKTEPINYDPVYQAGLRMIDWKFVGQCLLAAVVGAVIALVVIYYNA